MLALLRPSFGRYALRVVGVLALICVTVWSGSVGCLWVNEDRLVFRANRSRVITPVIYDDFIELRSGDGLRLDAAALTTPGASYWILFCPPAAGTIHGRLQFQLETLRELGYNVFAFDYRGFGRNPGRPSEEGLYEDALAAYRYLVQARDVPPSRIIIAGRSLGSAVAVELSTRVSSAGLLVFSALDSVAATAGRLYPWAPVRLLAANRFDSMDKAANVRVPVLQVHGVNDSLIPLAAARALFEQFPGPKRLIETGGGHNRAGLGPADGLAEALGELWPTSPSLDVE